jgi:hypothetical protein
VCGDPFQDVGPDFTPYSRRYFGPGAVVRNASAPFRARVAVSTNHGGRMRLAVCPRANATQACFDDPANFVKAAAPPHSHYWYLRADDQRPDVMRRVSWPAWFADRCRGRGCVVQWWWVGYQSCALPCEPWERDPLCGTNPTNPTVPACDSIARTEQFRNCADVVQSAAA